MVTLSWFVVSWRGWGVKGPSSSATGDFKNLIRAVRKYALPKQSDSRALLRWFLFNVYRLEETAAQDSVCDDTNDKGIEVSARV
jgi:hypothetical protein